MTFSKEFFSVATDNVENLLWKINNIQYYLVLCKLGALYFQPERFLWKHQKQSFADVLQNMSSEKFRKFCTKIPVSQSLYNQVADPRLGLQLDYKETPTQEFSSDTYEIMKNILFYRTLIWEHFRWLHQQLTYIYFTKVTWKHLWRRLFCK